MVRDPRFTERDITLTDATSAHEGKRLGRSPEFEPLLVSNTTAKRIINVGNTKYWALVKSGQIKLVLVGNRRMAVFSSLKDLTRAR